MKIFTSPVFIIFSVLAIFFSCKSSAPLTESTQKQKVTGPEVLIYKTRADYRQYVPVILSPDKKALISYPAPGDVFYMGDLAYPVQLENGFLLDRRGISKDCAFLKWTYYEYSRLKVTPSQEEIMKMILDSDPLTALYSCGKRSKYSDLNAELNQLIGTEKFDQFVKLK